MDKSERDLTTGKKIHLISTYSNVEKKNPDFFVPFFKTLSLFSRLFPINCFANFKTFLRIQDPVQTLYISTGHFLA